MEFDAVLLPARRAAMVQKGLWHDRTINQDLDACLATCPDKLALTALRVESGEIRRFTYREMARMADRIAVGLSRLGVGKNDVVACQLPNWWEFTLTYLACSRLGAVINPLMHIFRERELNFMLTHGQAKVMIAPKIFRGHDFEKMIGGINDKLPDLKHLVIVDGDGANGFDTLLSGPAWEEAADAQSVLGRNRPGPDDITQLIYTSGTTGEPKGVMHSANTVMANIIPYAQRLKLSADDVQYRKVALNGHFDNAKENFVFTTDVNGDPVYHVLTPFITDDGRTLMVDRGEIPGDLMPPHRRVAVDGPIRVTGVWRVPDSPGYFTPRPDAARHVWYARDLGGMTAADGIRLAAPVVIEADATPNPGGWPKGGQTVVDFPNNHLSYAITWFGLAAGLIGVYFAYHVSKGRLSWR